jgi:site-specific DNA-methyltransferase (adenine-specific)
MAIRLVRRFSGDRLKGKILQGDALEFLSSLDDASASIVFLDPPFNLGKTYSGRRKRLDKKPLELYGPWLSSLLKESTRVLAKGGLLFVYHLPIWGIQIGAELNQHLKFLHWIAVSMKNGFVRGPRLYPAHYCLLLYSKGKPRYLKRPRVPLAECRHCGEYVKDYGGYLNLVESRGVNLSDVWEDLSPVRHANRKHRKANELPFAMLHRVVEIGHARGKLFVDPFAGSGVGLVAAARAGMHFAGCDLLPQNCEIIVRRLSSIK